MRIPKQERSRFPDNSRVCEYSFAFGEIGFFAISLAGSCFLEVEASNKTKFSY